MKKLLLITILILMTTAAQAATNFSFKIDKYIVFYTYEKNNDFSLKAIKGNGDIVKPKNNRIELFDKDNKLEMTIVVANKGKNLTFLFTDGQSNLYIDLFKLVHLRGVYIKSLDLTAYSQEQDYTLYNWRATPYIDIAQSGDYNKALSADKLPPALQDVMNSFCKDIDFSMKIYNCLVRYNYHNWNLRINNSVFCPTHGTGLECVFKNSKGNLPFSISNKGRDIRLGYENPIYINIHLKHRLKAVYIESLKITAYSQGHDWTHYNWRATPYIDISQIGKYNPHIGNGKAKSTNTNLIKSKFPEELKEIYNSFKEI